MTGCWIGDDWRREMMTLAARRESRTRRVRMTVAIFPALYQPSGDCGFYVDLEQLASGSGKGWSISSSPSGSP
jgi:hypothetical protein